MNSVQFCGDVFHILQSKKIAAVGAIVDHFGQKRGESVWCLIE